MLFGQIRDFVFRLPGKMRFRVMIYDNQLVTEPTVFIKPKSRLLRFLELEDKTDGLEIMSRKYGLVVLRRRIVTPGNFIPVIQPGRLDRKPYVPLEQLLQMSAV